MLNDSFAQLKPVVKVLGHAARIRTEFFQFTASDSNWTDWSSVQGVIARVISKSDEREALGRFETTKTITQGPITN